MIGEAALRLSLRRSGLNVNDDRRRSDPGGGSTTKRRFSVRSSFRSNTNGSFKESEHESFVVSDPACEKRDSFSQVAAHRASEKRDSFRAGLPQSLLQTYYDRDCVAPIKIAEINFGPKLGAGEYSNVFEIESFHLRDVQDQDAKTKEELFKRTMLKQCEKYRETKKARYALKRLKGEYFRDNEPEKCIQAVSDLALEAEFLASLNHPHIMKLRGVAFDGTSGFESGPTGYFLIIDRLFETLGDRIKRWAKSSAAADSGKGKSFSLRRSISLVVGTSAGKGSKRNFDKTSSLPSSTPIVDKQMDERLSVALQISAGLKYLHSHHIIFRDLKPANIGFDVRGDVKIFDFGLARVMPDDGCPYTDTFIMSGAGSPRYMAPECLALESYNLKADIYSFAIIFWEMLSASQPYSFVKSREQLIRHVVQKDGRPQIDEKWPEKIKGMLESSFDKDIILRPKASLFYDIIRDEIKKIRNGNARGLNDTWLQRRRSEMSLRRLFCSEEERLEEVDESFHRIDGSCNSINHRIDGSCNSVNLVDASGHSLNLIDGSG